MNKQKQAFTLVELIVVITILAILGTIAFISLQGYSADARDSNRISDLSTMKTSLELFNLNAGKYPETTNGFTVTYSGTEVWTQGIFGSSTTNNVNRLDKTPLDPLTEKEYTYSTTKTKQEFQLSGIFEGDKLSLNNGLLNTANAGTKKATAVVTGNYNGLLFKTSTGANCSILSVPSIISSQPETITDLVTILTNSGLVYNGFNNLPTNYRASSFDADGGFGFQTNKLVVYSDTNNCSALYKKDSTARTILVKNLQTAYSGTIIANTDTIQNIINIDVNDTVAVEQFGSTLVNNSLAGSVTIVNALVELNICNLSTKPFDNGYIQYTTLPTIPNQNYIKGGLECGYTCTNGFSGDSCEIAPVYPSCTAKGEILTASSTYGSCSLPDYLVCSGIGSGDVISACNVGTNISGLTSSSYGGYYQFGSFNTSFVIPVGAEDWVARVAPNYLGSSENWGVSVDNTSIATFNNSSSANKIKMQGPCLAGYHVPTYLEFSNILSSLSGVSDISAALNIPKGSTKRYFDGTVYSTYLGVYTYLWTSSPLKFSTDANYLKIFSSSTSFGQVIRSNGNNIRCIKD